MSEGITNIEWSVYGKIRNITKNDGTNISYTYDAAGNRISKEVNGKKTWYIGDASGNVMSIYSKDATGNSGHLTQTEVHLYGSSRLGIFNVGKDMEAPQAEENIITFTTGKKFFELTNHLGNVLATVSDRKTGVHTNGDGIVDYYTADIVSANDYYPFGMMMPGRKYSTEGYRYGFNGKELDIEVAGTTTYDYGFRIYNPGLGRFLSVDPKPDVPISPYNGFAGNPILFTDVLGDTILPYAVAAKLGRTLPGQNISTDAQIIGNYTIKGVYKIEDGKASGSAIGYQAYKDGRLDYEMRPEDLDDFKKGVKFYSNVAELIYQPGASESMQKIGVGIGSQDYSYALQGVREENKRALTDPVFIMQFGLSLTHAYVSSITRFSGNDAITGRLQQHVSRAAREVDALGDKAFTVKQLQAIHKNPSLRAMYRGNRIDVRAREYIKSDPVLQHHLQSNYSRGADFVDPSSRIWWDMTTPNQWRRHVNKYGPGGTLLKTK